MKTLLILLVGLSLVACAQPAEVLIVTTTPEPATTVPPTAPPPTPNIILPTEAQLQVTTPIPMTFRVIDGDTMEVTDSLGIYTIRLIGIDTPETGQPGFSEAARAVSEWITSRIIIVADSGKLDKYDRRLAYLRTLAGEDFGLYLISHGFAIARYDGLDGYDWHEMQDAYRQAGDAYVLSLTPTAIVFAPTATRQAAATAPPSAVYYANCTEARAAGAAPIYRGQPGYRSGLDRDDDGVACEG